jgi:hypothetical protein
LKYFGDISHGDRKDRAEGLTLYEENKLILVVDDRLVKERQILDDRATVIGVSADIFRIE